jgi:hypothetical protein
MKTKNTLLQLALTGALFGGTFRELHAAQQTLILNRGWNLISLYVQPQDSAVESVFANVIAQHRLTSIYTYEYSGYPVSGAWKRYLAGQPGDRSWVNTLTSLTPMRGYWVNVANGLPVTFAVSGVLATNQQVILQPGWNLIGLGNDADTHWADAFGPTAGAVQALFGFDYTAYAFQGFTAPVFQHADVNGDGVVGPNEFDWVYAAQVGQAGMLRAGQGYWVKVSSPLLLEPLLEVEAESDVDPFAPGATTNWWFQPGIDTDLNGNGILDYGFTMMDPLVGLPQLDPYGNPYLNTQDTIWFRVPTGGSHTNLAVLDQNITVLNVGNGGYLRFEAETDVPWLVITPSSGSVAPGVGGQVVSLQANLVGLPIGERSGTLLIRSNGGDKSYAVRLTVPPLDGMYEGEVTITNIQSRAVAAVEWPIQLSLNLMGQSYVVAMGSPQFPQDLILTNNGTTELFDLSGSISLGADDLRNPYRLPLQRSVRLRGGRIQPPADVALGKNLGVAGEYTETLTGLPAGPLILRGFFSVTTKTDKHALEEP